MAPRFIPARRRAVVCLLCISLVLGLIWHFNRCEKVVACGLEKAPANSLMPASVCDCKKDCKVDGFLNELITDNTPPPSCKPVNNILFLKTHKTGSSTVTNILNRYGDTRDLLFALPIVRTTYSFFWPRSFQLRFTQAFGRAPNILCNHARYNKVPMNWLFPKDTTRYITLLREPTQHFESIYNFFQLGRRFLGLRNNVPLQTFLQNTTFYLQQRKNITGVLTLIKNPALFELGLDTKYHENLDIVQKYIHFRLQQEFDVVLLVEYIDESLVLLKRRFCWRTDDILYFKLNERMDKHKQDISSAVKVQIKKWNSGDVLLYDVFNRTLWRMIKEEGPDFFEDLARFREELENIKRKCLREGNFLTRPYSGRLVRGYALRPDIPNELNETCNKMIMNEIPYLNHHRDKLIKLYQTIDRPVNRPFYEDILGG